MSKSKVTIVDDVGEGLYIWERANGQWIIDEDRNVLSMPSKKGDERKLAIFTKYAHNVLTDMGVEPDGQPRFLPGHRQISDEEYEEQKARQDAGLIADPFDVGAIQDEMRNIRLGKN